MFKKDVYVNDKEYKWHNVAHNIKYKTKKMQQRSNTTMNANVTVKNTNNRDNAKELCS